MSLQSLTALRQAMQAPGARVYVWTEIGCTSYKAGDKSLPVGVFAEVGKTQFRQALATLSNAVSVQFRTDPATNAVFVRYSLDAE